MFLSGQTKSTMRMCRNLRKIILSAYQWLSENYKPEDKIYLFGVLPSFTSFICRNGIESFIGFSRGAYQVRIISGMIDVVCTAKPTYHNNG